MKKIFFKKVLTASLISMMFGQMMYIALVEPKTAIAATAPDTVIVTLNVDAGISISAPADVVLPALAVGTNTSIGTAAWTVVTNNNAGYKLDVKASASPALVSGANSFADYTEGTPGTPDTWSVPSGSKEFGFSARGTAVNTTTWGTGSDCGTGIVPSATLKYIGFETTDRTIATNGSPTAYAGVATNICFAVEQDTIFAQSGTYTATITATATTL